MMAFRLPKFRLLPVVMGAATLLLGVKCFYFVSGVTEIIAPAYARSISDTIDIEELAEIAPASGGEEGATTPEHASPEMAATPATDAGKQGASAMADTFLPDASNMSRSEIELLQELSVRRGELKQRESELDIRERLLQATEKGIDAKIAKLKDIEAQIKQVLVVHNEQEEAQLKSLVKVYETMKPKDAARIFEKLDMSILIEVVERMSERKIAPVLAEMSSDSAKALTVELATRKQMPEINIGS